MLSESTPNSEERDRLILIVRDVDSDYHGTGPLALSGAEAALIADAVLAAGYRQIETRARRRIREAVESRGYDIKSLIWEPIYNSGEMGGLAGGWSLELDRDYLENTHPGNDLCALSVEELLAQIDYWLAPEEPCSCDRSHSADMAARHINDPQKPTHGPECKWHIRYRLRWWSEGTPE